MNWNELPLNPHHLGVPSRAPKMISKPIPCSAQTVHQSCVKINTISNRTKTSFYLIPCHLGGPSGVAKTISMPVVHSTNQNELPLDPRHLRVPSGMPKTISEPIACSTQTMHLSCIEINYISKQTKMSFYLTHVTKEVHRVQLKGFPCPWCIKHILCTYLVPRLPLSANEQKGASTCPTSPKSSIGWAQNDFWVYCTFRANCAPILHRG
jgi:hypothetical protein